MPSNNSSNPFITSTHSGTDDLKKRWIEDKAIKEAGWPAHIVKQCTSDQRLLESWDLLILALGKKLIGEDTDYLFDTKSEAISTTITISNDEVEALGAHYLDESQLVMPLFSAPVELHILVSPEHSYPVTGYPPMYITSNSVPAYIRLHLLSRLLTSAGQGGFIEAGEGLCMAAMRILEEEWASIENNGPPDMSVVLQHLIPRSITSLSPHDDSDINSAETQPNQNGRKRIHVARRDDRSERQVREDFDKLCQNENYVEMFKTRKKLPAFTSKEDFLDKLQNSQVVIVVGETGNLNNLPSLNQ